MTDQLITSDRRKLLPIVRIDPLSAKRGSEQITSNSRSNCWFHGWSGTSEYPNAIVEDISGMIYLVSYEHVQFIEIRS